MKNLKVKLMDDILIIGYEKFEIESLHEIETKEVIKLHPPILNIYKVGSYILKTTTKYFATIIPYDLTTIVKLREFKDRGTPILICSNWSEYKEYFRIKE